MVKLAFIPVLLVAACVAAAAYGAVHNQISYTVGPGFFHDDLFWRFHIPSGLRNRAGASVVGIIGTWWMGLLIGPPVLLVGLILPGWKAYLKHSLIAFGVVAGTALVVGLVALGVACLRLSDGDDRAGTMHDFGYLGGGVGILTATAYLIVVRVRLGKRTLASRAP